MKLTFPNGSTIESNDPSEIARFTNGNGVGSVQPSPGAGPLPLYRAPADPNEPMRKFWRSDTSRGPYMGIPIFVGSGLVPHFGILQAGLNEYPESVLEASPSLRKRIDLEISRGWMREVGPDETIEIGQNMVDAYERLITYERDPAELRKYLRVPNARVVAAARKKLSLVETREVASEDLSGTKHHPVPRI